MNDVPVPGFYEFVQWKDGDNSNPRVISDVSNTMKLTAITRLKNYVVLRDDMEDEYFDKMAALYYGDTPVSLDSIIYLRNMQANQWQVFNLPFALNTEDSPFDGKVYCYTTATRNADSGIDLWFSKYSGVLEPGVPYLFYGAAVNRPVFTNMTQTLQLTDAIITPYYTDGQTDESMIRFQGSNRMMLLKGGERNILLLSNSRLYYPNVQGALLRPFRGYFKVGSAGSAAPRFRIVVEGRTVTELEAVPEDGTLQAENVRKYIEDGQLVIERNGVRYDATGARRE